MKHFRNYCTTQFDIAADGSSLCVCIAHQDNSMAASEELKRKADQLASIFGPAELPKLAKWPFEVITKAERASQIKSEEIDHTPRAIDKKSDFFSLGQTFLIEP